MTSFLMAFLCAWIECVKGEKIMHILHVTVRINGCGIASQYVNASP